MSTRARRLIGLLTGLLLAGSLNAQPPWHPDVAPSPSGQPVYLGVFVEELAFGKLDALQLPYGVLISRVLPDSPAQRGGLRPGDIILELNDQPVFSVSRLRWLVQAAAADKPVEVEYYRGGESSTARIDLHAPGERTAPGASADMPGGLSSSSYLGIGLQSLTPGLRDAFAVPDGIGVLIAEVYPDTPAAKSGLSAGDVLVKMDRRTIQTIPDVHRVLDYFDPGEQLDIEVIRDGARQSVTVTLGERAQAARPEQRPTAPGGPEPILDPAWWKAIEEFAEHWREYFEQKRPAPPPAAL
jgi:S1-C subfamily serine protease